MDQKTNLAVFRTMFLIIVKRVTKVRIKIVLPVTLLVFTFSYRNALAVPPPDFIFNVGGQIVQIFAIVVLFVSAGASMFFNYLRARLKMVKKHVFIAGGVALVVIVAVSYGISYLFGVVEQQNAYDQWLKESDAYVGLTEEREENMMDVNDQTSISVLDIGGSQTISDGSEERFVSNISADLDGDAQVEFIKNYYSAIANHDFEKAYGMWKKTVPLDTFIVWYKDTTRITLDNFTQIDAGNSSLELTLYEGNHYVRYATLMSLKFDNGRPVQVEKSTVKILGEGVIQPVLNELNDANIDSSANVVNVANKAVDETRTISGYYEEHKNLPLSISNQDFNNVLQSGLNDYIVLDAREDLEYMNGNFPGSLHIRYADLQAGKWVELPDDKTIYVFCWSGIRGKEVANFLRGKEITVRYLEGGASAWVDFGGSWNGNIDFKQKFSEDRYKVVYSTDEVRNYVENGVFLVDTREPWRYDKSHIAGSVNIPIMYTLTIKIADAFMQVPEGSTVITVCDDYVNCFDAKITGVELENRGYKFIGRFNRPWEY